MNKDFDLIGDDCKNIIFDYYYQIVKTQKFNKCLEDINKLKYSIIYDEEENYYYSRLECNEGIFTKYKRVSEVYDNDFDYVEYCFDYDTFTLSSHSEGYDSFHNI